MVSRYKRGDYALENKEPLFIEEDKRLFYGKLVTPHYKKGDRTVENLLRLSCGLDGQTWFDSESLTSSPPPNTPFIRLHTASNVSQPLQALSSESDKN